MLCGVALLYMLESHSAQALWLLLAPALLWNSISLCLRGQLLLPGLLGWAWQQQQGVPVRGWQQLLRWMLLTGFSPALAILLIDQLGFTGLGVLALLWQAALLCFRPLPCPLRWQLVYLSATPRRIGLGQKLLVGVLLPVALLLLLTQAYPIFRQQSNQQLASWAHMQTTEHSLPRLAQYRSKNGHWPANLAQAGLGSEITRPGVLGSDVVRLHWQPQTPQLTLHFTGDLQRFRLVYRAYDDGDAIIWKCQQQQDRSRAYPLLKPDCFPPRWD